MVVTRWYNLFALFWITQFIIGCQHFIIAGSVATWFFTRNKNNLESPISRSFWNLIRYHLGSIALGSLLIASLQMIRALLKFLQVRYPISSLNKSDQLSLISVFGEQSRKQSHHVPLQFLPMLFGLFRKIPTISDEKCLHWGRNDWL